MQYGSVIMSNYSSNDYGSAGAAAAAAADHEEYRVGLHELIGYLIDRKC